MYSCHFLISSASVRSVHTISFFYCAHLCIKSALGISNFLEEISSLSHSIVFLYFFALITEELPNVQADFRKGRGTRNQIANIGWIMEKARQFQKSNYFCFMPKSLTVWITTNCGKFFKRCKSMADSCQCMTKPLQYFKVISLQLIKINGKKFKKKKERERWEYQIT